MKKIIPAYILITGMLVAFGGQSALAAQKHDVQEKPVLSGLAINGEIIWPRGSMPVTNANLQLLAQSQGRISASQAKSVAMRFVPGAKFVNVQFIKPATYRVRLQQKNGRIIDVYVDAYTGNVKN